MLFHVISYQKRQSFQLLSPVNVSFNIICTSIPGLWVIETWIFLYLKSKFHLFHCNRYKTTEEDLLSLDKIRNQSTQVGMCQASKSMKITLLF